MKERIKTAIEILTTNHGDGWFTVLEEPKKEKFIQFTYDEGYGLQVDLPVVALQPDELAKAEKLMAEYGISKIEVSATEDCCCCEEDHDHEEHCDCGCESEEKFESFNKKIDEYYLASDIAYRVFKEVYGYDDDTALNVTIFR